MRTIEVNRPSTKQLLSNFWGDFLEKLEHFSGRESIMNCLYIKKFYSSCSTWYIKAFRQSLACMLVFFRNKKIEALIRSMKFLSPEVALYLYKTTIRPCMEYCCHVWAGAPSCYLELFDKLQKQICRTVGPSLAASLKHLAHSRNVASLSFSIGITLVDVHMT